MERLFVHWPRWMLMGTKYTRDHGGYWMRWHFEDASHSGLWQ